VLLCAGSGYVQVRFVTQLGTTPKVALFSENVVRIILLNVSVTYTVVQETSDDERWQIRHCEHEHVSVSMILF